MGIINNDLGAKLKKLNYIQSSSKLFTCSCGWLVPIWLFWIKSQKRSSLLKHSFIYFGLLIGTLPNVEGIDQADKEPDECEKEDDKLEEGQQNTSIQIEHQAPGNILPATPLQSSRWRKHFCSCFDSLFLHSRFTSDK